MARALYEEVQALAGFAGFGGETWDELDDEPREFFIKMARSALKAAEAP